MAGVALIAFFASICGLVAAWCWFKVSASVDTSGEIVKGPHKRDLSNAATATALAFGLASIAALLGIYASGV